MKILFICTGNTCRSPMAEAILKNKFPEAEVRSAGIFAGEDMPANLHAIEALKERDIGLNHRSQSITDELLQWADLVLTMTNQHKHSLTLGYPQYQDKYFTLKEYVLDSDIDNDISDPFGRELTVYQETFCELDTYISLLIKKIYP